MPIKKNKKRIRLTIKVNQKRDVFKVYYASNGKLHNGHHRSSLYLPVFLHLYIGLYTNSIYSSIIPTKYPGTKKT